jgi:hypothetical protein
MKADRKALESNVLIHKWEQVVEGIKKGPSRSTLVWLGVIALAALIYFAYRYFSSSSAEGNSGRWYMVDQALFPQQLEGLVEQKDLQGTTQGKIVRFKEARLKLRDGIRNLDSDQRSKALDNIREATKMFEELAKDSGPVPVLHQEALISAAIGNETLGNLEQAKTYYARLVKEHPETFLGKKAEAQIKRLEDPANKQDLQDIIKNLGLMDTASPG